MNSFNISDIHWVLSLEKTIFEIVIKRERWFLKNIFHLKDRSILVDRIFFGVMNHLEKKEG